MVIPWHTDQAYSGKLDIKDFVDPEKAALKFFFYLTDVDSENGCLGYIPGSNRISYVLKKLILENKINYSPYWSLADYRNLIKNPDIRNKLENFLRTEETDSFLDKTSFILEKHKDTENFDIIAEEGSLLIFDESGVHRGAVLKKSDRVCLRYFYRKK